MNNQEEKTRCHYFWKEVSWWFPVYHNIAQETEIKLKNYLFNHRAMKFFLMQDHCNIIIIMQHKCNIIKDNYKIYIGVFALFFFNFSI